MPLPGAASVEVATSSAKNCLEHSSETAPRSSVVRGCETAEPQQDSSPNLRKPTPAKVPNVAFWGPKERWCNDAIAWSGLRGSGHFIRKKLSGAWLRNSPKELSRAWLRNSTTPSRIQAQTCENNRPQKCLTLRSEDLKKDDAMMPLPGAAPVEVATSSARNSLEHSSETAPRSLVVRGCETAEPQQDSSPNLRKPTPAKVPNVAFWSPKERWCNDAIAWSGLRGSGHFIRKELSGA